jgi:hypothetical protein
VNSADFAKDTEKVFFKNDPHKITITVPEFIEAISKDIDVKSNGMLEGLVKEDELLDRNRIRTIMFEIMMKIRFTGKNRRYKVNKDGEAKDTVNEELTAHEMHYAPQLHAPPMHVPPMHVPPMHVPPMYVPPMHVPPMHVPPVYFPPGFSP